MAVTIYDIARRVGASHATVSRALRDDPAVAEATRRRVQREARRMNYQPNLVARGLIRGETQTVGLIIGSYGVEATISKIMILDRLARRDGYHLLVTSCVDPGRPDRLVEAVANLQSRGVDGVLLYGVGSEAAKQIQRLRDLGGPLVFFDRFIDAEAPGVLLDRAAGVRAAVDRLVELGHREIVFVNGGLSQGDPYDRVEGFLRSCRRHRLARPVSRLVSCPSDRDADAMGRAIERFVADRMRRAAPPTAWLGSNDLIALALAGEIRRRGYEIPRDVSVVGFDDTAASRCFRPALTTIGHVPEEVSEAAWSLLQKAVASGESGSPGAGPVVIRSRLIERESIAPAPGVASPGRA